MIAASDLRGELGVREVRLPDPERQIEEAANAGANRFGTRRMLITTVWPRAPTRTVRKLASQLTASSTTRQRLNPEHRRRTKDHVSPQQRSGTDGST